MSQFAKIGTISLKKESLVKQLIMANSLSPLVKRQNGIQIISDVHLEFRKKSGPPIIHPIANHLALLGDIGKPFDSSYHDFIAIQAQNFEHVFVIMGNHEYYNKGNITVDAVLKKARSICSEWNNVHLLERDIFELNDKTTIIGCTLWSPLNEKTAQYLNDMNMIYVDKENAKGKPKKKLLDVQTYFSWHLRDVQWLQSTLKTVKEQNRQAIVLTHHGPLMDMSGKYRGNQFNSGFVSNLKHLFEPPAIAFASGHVHSNVDVCVNGVRSVSNALGYPGEDTGFKEDVIVSWD